MSGDIKLLELAVSACEGYGNDHDYICSCRPVDVREALRQLTACQSELAAERIWGETAQHRLAELYTLVQQVLDKIEKFRTHEEAEDFEAAGGRE